MEHCQESTCLRSRAHGPCQRHSPLLLWDVADHWRSCILAPRVGWTLPLAFQDVLVARTLAPLRCAIVTSEFGLRGTRVCTSRLLFQKGRLLLDFSPCVLQRASCMPCRTFRNSCNSFSSPLDLFHHEPVAHRLRQLLDSGSSVGASSSSQQSSLDLPTFVVTKFPDLDASCVHRFCMSTCFALPSPLRLSKHSVDAGWHTTHSQRCLSLGPHLQAMSDSHDHSSRH